MKAFKLDEIELKAGSHADRDKGVCAMEAVAWLAGEPHSDAPQCACPVLTRFVQKLNDKWTDDERQLLKPYLPKLIGTRYGNSLKRVHILAHAALTVFAPFALDLAKLPKEAGKLRALKFGEWEINNKVAADAAAAAYSAYSAAAHAAYSAYSDAAHAAAYSAAAAHAAAAAADAAAAHAAYSAYSDAAHAAAYSAAAAHAADAAADAAYSAAAYSAKTARAQAIQLALQALDQAIECKDPK